MHRPKNRGEAAGQTKHKLRGLKSCGLKSSPSPCLLAQGSGGDGGSPMGSKPARHPRGWLPWTVPHGAGCTAAEGRPPAEAGPPAATSFGFRQRTAPGVCTQDSGLPSAAPFRKQDLQTRRGAQRNEAMGNSPDVPPGIAALLGRGRSMSNMAKPTNSGRVFPEWPLPHGLPQAPGGLERTSRSNMCDPK